MTLYKPEVTAKPSGGFLGVQETGIVQFKDRSGEYDWADVFIEIEIAIPNSKYTNTLSLKGAIEKNDAGEVSGGSVLKRLYGVFEAIGCTAGINLKGEWESDDGQIIPNIAEYLNERFAEGGFPDKTDVPFNYVSFAYKIQNKLTKKVYTEVYPKLCANTTKGKAELSSYIKWMQNKGFLNEYKENSTGNATPTTQATLDNL